MSSLVQFMDEGTSSPFVARLFSSMISMRDQLYLIGKEDNEKLSIKFDKQFHPMLESMIASRNAAKKTIKLIKDHSQDILDRKVVKFTNNQNITVKNTIDLELGQTIDMFLDQSVIAIKYGLQTILSESLDLDIGFMFQKDNKFRIGLNKVRNNDGNDLANYLFEIRSTWFSDFNDLRNQHQHGGWSLETLKYIPIKKGELVVKLPELLGIPVNKFVRVYGNRILLFIENMMVYSMQRSKVDFFPICLSEIPIEKRDPLNPVRFRLVPKGLQNLPCWKLKYEEVNDFI